MRILVTGAGGFIGSHLARHLHEKGYFVRAIDIKWDGFMPEPYFSEKVTADLRDMKVCMEVTRDIDWVFHLAADMGGIGYITYVKSQIISDNALMNINMIKSSVENKVKRFFFSSSACVYPEYRQLTENIEPLREDMAEPAQPDTYYGWEKFFSEKLLLAFYEDKKLDVRIARFHNVFGPYGTWKGGREKAPAALCRKVAEAPDGAEIEIWGDGKQTRSFLFIDDCIEGIMRLMNSDYPYPINIGSDRLVSIDELADIIIRISGKKLRKVYRLDAPQGVRGRNADLTLVKKVLGWYPKVSLEKGLEITYRWIEKMVMEERKKEKRKRIEMGDGRFCGEEKGEFESGVFLD